MGTIEPGKNQPIEAPPVSPEEIRKIEKSTPEPLIEKSESAVPKAITENIKPVNLPNPEPPKPALAAQGQDNSKNIPKDIPKTPNQPIVQSSPALKNAIDEGKRNRRLVTGCLSAFGCSTLIFVVIALIFLSQETETESVVAKMLGVSFAELKNILILILNIVFTIIAFITFIVAIIGIFKIFMSKKEDKVAKRKGVVMAISSSLILFLSIFFLIFINIFYPTVDVERKPVAAIVTDPKELFNLSAPIKVKFDATNITPEKNNQILSYVWDFGDGETDTGQIVEHEFKDKGENGEGRFIVKLTVESKNNKTDEETKDEFSVDVTIANVKPEIVLEAVPETGEAPLKVVLDAAKSVDDDGEIISFDWDLNEDQLFDDKTGEKIEYTFENAGIYKVGVRATDNKNEYSILEKEIEVKESNAPKAIVKIEPNDTKLVVNKSYLFSGEDSSFKDGKITKYEWDFGDKTTAETMTQSHTYANTGTFNLKLKVTEEGGKVGETSLEMEVIGSESSPSAVISSVPSAKDNQLKGSAPFEVNFDGSASTDPNNNIVDYKWDFESDGVIDQSAKTAKHTFDKPGDYEVTLKVMDADKNEAQTRIKVVVEAQALKAVLNASPISGEIPLEVSFDASGSNYSEGEIVAYQWDFGDGSDEKIDDPKLTYRYNKIGTYVARVTVIANDNSQAFAETTITVKEVALSACFETNKKEGKAPLTIKFDPECSTGTISKYLWDFGGLDTLRTREPIYTFKNPGTYNVKLEIEDNDGIIDSFAMDIIVAE